MYQLIAINNSSCADTALVNVTINAKPSLGADLAISKCTDSTKNLTILFTTAGLTTNWTLGGNAVANPAAVSAAGVYQLIATNSFGCADTALVTLTNNQQLCPVVIPTPLPEQITINYCITPGRNPCNPPVTDLLPVLIVRNVNASFGISVYSISGQLVYKMNGNHTAGTTTYSIPLKKMVAGIYIVTVRFNNEKAVTKRIIRRG